MLDAQAREAAANWRCGGRGHPYAAIIRSPGSTNRLVVGKLQWRLIEALPVVDRIESGNADIDAEKPMPLGERWRLMQLGTDLAPPSRLVIMGDDLNHPNNRGLMAYRTLNTDRIAN